MEDEQAVPNGEDSVPAPRRRHRRAANPGRTHVLKVRLTQEELAVLREVAAMKGLGVAGYVGGLSVTTARRLVQRMATMIDPAAENAEGAKVSEASTSTSSGLKDTATQLAAEQLAELMAELLLARVAVRRYAVNVNQAVAKLHSTGEAPVWLVDASAGASRAVARIDDAASQVNVTLNRLVPWDDGRRRRRTAARASSSTSAPVTPTQAVGEGPSRIGEGPACDSDA